MPDGKRLEYDTQDYIYGIGVYTEIPADTWTPFDDDTAQETTPAKYEQISLIESGNAND